VAVYLRFLLTNRLRKSLTRVAAAASGLAVAAEGLLFAQGGALPSSSVALREVSGMAALVASGGLPSQTALARAQESLTAHMESLAKDIRIGSRLQKKGTEAEAAHAAAKELLAAEWETFQVLFLRYQATKWGTPSLARGLALDVPLRALETTLRLDVPTDNLSAYISQLLAGTSALSAMGREFSYECRLCVASGTAFPSHVGVELVVSGAESTGLVLTDRAGQRPSRPHSAAALGVQVGDAVTLNGATTTVSAVSGTGITFAAPLPFTRVSSLEVAPEGVRAWRTGQRTLSSGFLGAGSPGFLALYPDLPAHVQKLEGREAGRVRELVSFLATLERRLVGSLSSDTSSLLSRLGVPISSLGAAGAVVQTVLAAGTPTPTQDDKELGRAVLLAVGEEGFDRARKLLSEGMIDLVLRMEFSEATFAGYVSATFGALSSGLPQDTFLGRG